MENIWENLSDELLILSYNLLGCVFAYGPISLPEIQKILGEDISKIENCLNNYTDWFVQESRLKSATQIRISKTGKEQMDLAWEIIEHRRLHKQKLTHAPTVPFAVETIEELFVDFYGCTETSQKKIILDRIGANVEAVLEEVEIWDEQGPYADTIAVIMDRINKLKLQYNQEQSALSKKSP